MARTDDGTHVVQTRVDGVIVNRSELTAERELQRTVELRGARAKAIGRSGG